MNIYLDIDGVLLGKGWKPALHVKEFLTYFIERHSCYWLTTHCKGDANTAINYIGSIDKDLLELVKKIKPTNWSYTKTDAIDFETPFIWFDDYLFEFEKEQLNKNGCFSSWVKVNLEENPDQLKDILDLFKDLKK